jgi:hypothetical protein
LPEKVTPEKLTLEKLTPKKWPLESKPEKVTPKRLPSKGYLGRLLTKQFIYKPIRNPMRISSRIFRFVAWPVPTI